MLVQIYGLTTPDDARDVDRLRPDTVGVVLDENLPTWDSVDADTARRIVSSVSHARVVALSLSTDPDRILATVRTLGPDIVHLARAQAIDEEALRRVRAAVSPAQLMLTAADTKHPETGVVGASGRTHDWAVSAAIVQALDTPVILAGGLGPENVRDAIAAVRPFGVDSETRTSLEGDRRRKDMAKVEAFIALARAG